MGDIGCLGTKTKLSGESMEAYHIFVGGGFGQNQAVGRQIFSGVLASELAPTLERLLRAFLRHRQGRETFQQFTTRHDIGTLQQLFEEQVVA